MNRSLPHISLRSATQALSGLAEARVLQGDYEGASQCLLAASKLGRRVESHGLLISTMIGLALQSIALDTSIGLFDINRNLSAKTWGNLSSGLLEAAPPENLLEHSIQGEMTAFHNTMELYRQGKYQDQELDQLRHFPGLLSREERIYLNTMTGLLHQLPAQNGLTIPPGIRNPTAYDWISGKTGWLSQIMTPNFVRAGEQIELHRKSILAAATAYAIAAYRAQEGRLPAQLDDLKNAGIEFVDDPGFLSLVKYESDGQNGELRVKVLDSHSDLIIPSGQYWEHPWFAVDQEEVVYKFHPLSSDQPASKHDDQGRN